MYQLRHNNIIMVEFDDMREGLMPEAVAGFCREVIKKYKLVNIYGLGTNARCIAKKIQLQIVLRSLQA